MAWSMEATVQLGLPLCAPASHTVATLPHAGLRVSTHSRRGSGHRDAECLAESPRAHCSHIGCQVLARWQVSGRGLEVPSGASDPSTARGRSLHPVPTDPMTRESWNARDTPWTSQPAILWSPEQTSLQHLDPVAPRHLALWVWEAGCPRRTKGGPTTQTGRWNHSHCPSWSWVTEHKPNRAGLALTLASKASYHRAGATRPAQVSNCMCDSHEAGAEL